MIHPQESFIVSEWVGREGVNIIVMWRGKGLVRNREVLPIG
jgi:hypothetical protein